MKSSYEVSNIVAVFEGVAEIALITTLFANTSYDELKAREPRLVNVVSRSKFDEIMSRVVKFADDVGIMSKSTLDLNPHLQAGVKLHD